MHADIPTHTHPVDKYVFVVSGSIKTGDRLGETGYCWSTPMETQQDPHE
jgi:hypothetical protein